MKGYYGQNEGYGRNDQPIVGNTQMPVRKLWKWKVIFAVIAVLFIVVLAIVVPIFIKDFFGPERAVQKYAEAFLTRDWETVYDWLEIPEGRLMTKEHFLKIYEGDKKVEATDLNVREGRTKRTKEREYVQQYTVHYREKGKSGRCSMDIQLIEGDEKNFFFFPKWKVFSEGIVAENVVIFAPAKYEIDVDGEMLEPISEAADEDSSIDLDDIGRELARETADEISGYDTYVENMFIGQHLIRASAENREPEESIFDLSSDHVDYYKVQPLEIKQESILDMESVVQRFMQELYREAMSQSQPSEDYLDYWTQEGTNPNAAQAIKEEAEELFQEFASCLQDGEYYDRVQFTSMNFSDYQSEVEDTYSDIQGNLYVNLYVTYQYGYTYDGISTSDKGITEKENQEDYGDSDAEVIFKWEDNRWKICSVDISSVY